MLIILICGLSTIHFQLLRGGMHLHCIYLILPHLTSSLPIEQYQQQHHITTEFIGAICIRVSALLQIIIALQLT